MAALWEVASTCKRLEARFPRAPVFALALLSCGPAPYLEFSTSSHGLTTLHSS